MSLTIDQAPPESPPPADTHDGDDGGSHARRWWILAVVVIAQLMVVLDATIVNIALPDAQEALDMSDTNRQWVVTAYSLAFGGLLLLGGRIADYSGRKRAFIVGAGGFAAASAIGGVAQTQEMLFAARALQGVFAAVLAPAALSILTLAFPGGPERTRAFAIYGGVSAGGAAVGLVLGGLLTEYFSWRYTLLINIPIAAVAAIGALRYISESKAHGTTRYDLPGATTVTLGLVSLVYGFTKAETDGWGSGTTLSLIGLGLALLVAFVAIERRSSHPLLPLRIPLDRNRGGAYLTALAAGAGMSSAFLFLVYYLQVVAGYSAIESGLASLPSTVGVIVAAGAAGPLVAKIGPRLVMSAGALIAAAGLIWFAQLGADSSFVTHILPAQIVFGAGLGLVIIPMSNLATVGVDSDDAGAASALTNASQQVGGSLGVALLNTFYGTAVANYLTEHAGERGLQNKAFMEGYSVAFTWAAAILVVAAAISFLIIRAKASDLPAADGTAVLTH